METLVARFEADGLDFLDGNPKRLLPDLYYLGDFNGAAVYGFFAESKFFLVDAPGGRGLKKFVKARLEQLGRKPPDLTAVLLTSCTAEATAGLGDLLERGSALVVGSSSGLDFIKKRCPVGTKIVAAEELARRGWFNVTPISLSGRGLAPLAYVVSLAGKTVLFSGRVPIRVTDQTWNELLPEISGLRETAADYLNSVNRLGNVRPDLWLPAVATDGWNANLYAGDWDDIIARNYRAGHAALVSSGAK